MPYSRSFLTRLVHDRRGNVLIIVAGAMAVLCFALGFGIDYSRAMKLQSKLNAAADAAALAAVNASMMQNSTSTAQQAATNMFNQQIAGLPGLIFNASTGLTVTVTTSGSLNNGRSATVTWQAASQNIFSGILGRPSLNLSGVSSANATKAPYLNFYIMFDTSPSMLLPATSTGLSQIMAATATTANPPYGCAFACHEMTPQSDGIDIRKGSNDIYLNANYYTSGATGYQVAYQVNSSSTTVWDLSGNVMSGYSFSSGKLHKSGSVVSGYYADGYWLTHNYPTVYPGQSAITLRIDEERSAAQALIPYAQQMASANQVTYNMQMFGFDWTHSNLGAVSPVTALTAMSDVNSLSASSVPDLYAAQDWWYANNKPTSSYSNSDMGTEFTNTLAKMLAIMPVPGDGSSKQSPQEVMFLVTDGMSDEGTSGGRWVRQLSTADLAQCTLIKSKGIKIAILYTQYLPGSMTGDSWSQSNVAPYLANVSPSLQSCASIGTDGSPLFYTVTTDQSISDALVSLFALTVQQSHLVQ
ncbi:MAG: hypothetical protein KGJ57_13690 [Sphingomonadales bacterium]|nr:hypothetical protein [Sphingomonadales bacterium]MDE2170466.1 hypothetical protein [Sphingomonadales bacterium]